MIFTIYTVFTKTSLLVLVQDDRRQVCRHSCLIVRAQLVVRSRPKHHGAPDLGEVRLVFSVLFLQEFLRLGVGWSCVGSASTSSYAVCSGFSSGISSFSVGCGGFSSIVSSVMWLMVCVNTSGFIRGILSCIIFSGFAASGSACSLSGCVAFFGLHWLYLLGVDCEGVRFVDRNGVKDLFEIHSRAVFFNGCKPRFDSLKFISFS